MKRVRLKFFLKLAMLGLSGVASAKSNSYDQHSITIEEMLHTLGVVVGGPQLRGDVVSRSCPVEPMVEDPLVGLPRSQFALSDAACAIRGRQQFFRRVCGEVRNNCLREYRSSACWRPESPRFYNPDAQRVVYQSTYQIFQRLTHAPDMLASCCRTHPNRSSCETAFQNTHLLILQGLGPESQVAQYRSESESVEAAEGMLLGCRDVQCIEALLLHELGHRCSDIQFAESSYFSRALNNDYGDYRDAADECDSDNPIRENLARIHDQDLIRCIDQEIQNQGGVCNAARFEEIFADAVFAEQRTGLSQFAWACGGVEDADHFGPNKYEPCLMALPRIRAQLCHHP